MSEQKERVLDYAGAGKRWPYAVRVAATTLAIVVAMILLVLIWLSGSEGYAIDGPPFRHLGLWMYLRIRYPGSGVVGWVPPGYSPEYKIYWGTLIGISCLSVGIVGVIAWFGRRMLRR